MPFDSALNACVIEQQLSMAVIKHCYSKTSACSLYVAEHLLKNAS